MAKFKFSVSTGYVGSKIEEIIEIEDEELAGLSESKKEKLIDEYFEEWLADNIYTGIEEI